MKKLYIGLGNPGREYERNRHNAGFLFVDYVLSQPLIKILNTDDNKKLQSVIAKVEMNSSNFLFVKPQTFVNNSGPAVKSVLSFFKYEAGDLVVVYDDLDIELGQFKIHDGLGPRTHNGVLSIENALKTQIFTQIRIGIHNPQTRTTDSEEVKLSGETYVLQNFSGEEQEKLEKEVFPRIFEQLKHLT